MQLRPYQANLKEKILASWQTQHKNVLAALPTGGGKTVLFSNIVSETPGQSIVIAHRKELVAQMSLALGREGVLHQIVAPVPTVQWITRQHQAEFSRHFINSGAPCRVAGVDTLISRIKRGEASWCEQIALWVQDEAHHVLQENKWGRAIERFTNAKGLGVTATPVRADGRGLGAHADGVFQNLVVGPDVRELIDSGHLTEYRIFNPSCDINIDEVAVSSATGDFNKTQLRKANERSHIVGDIVEHYKRLAAGKLGITFVVDVATATKTALAYEAAGVKAAGLSAKTPDYIRAELVSRFRQGKLLQLVNVDLFGEGFDLPAIEVVSMARHTASLGLYLQQFGRGLRPLPGKDHAIIIDHVNNVRRHRLPDSARTWTLDRRERAARNKKDPNLIPVTTCPECTAVYELIHKKCPYCGYAPKPAGRAGPLEVHGDLTEISQEELSALRGEIARINQDPAVIKHQMEYAGAPLVAAAGAAKNYRKRAAAHAQLRESIAWWAGHLKAKGTSDSESYRRFFFRFGTDVLTAQTLSKSEAETLSGKIWEDILGAQS
jgi:superfamily II DNA or RNA helicase